ncbi:hypothetical protein [Arenibaculum pallidiluteum]|uniref:hypothetical protein n=1 Tax=Arenibaculum pallidiluteum TaxID=2812559 RepID=UPI001A97B51F|nr:hypothetical protein [Arenibaculum pallidiluteum]
MDKLRILYGIASMLVSEITKACGGGRYHRAQQGSPAAGIAISAEQPFLHREIRSRQAPGGFDFLAPLRRTLRDRSSSLHRHILPILLCWAAVCAAGLVLDTLF